MIKEVQRSIDAGLARDRQALFGLADRLTTSPHRDSWRCWVIDAYGGMAVESYLKGVFNNLGLLSENQPDRLPIVNSAKSVSLGYRERIARRLAGAGLIGEDALIITEYTERGRAIGRLIDGLRSAKVARIDIAILGQSPHEKDDRFTLPEVGDIYIGSGDDDMPALAEDFFTENHGETALKPTNASASQIEIWQYTESALSELAAQYASPHCANLPVSGGLASLE